MDKLKVFTMSPVGPVPIDGAGAHTKLDFRGMKVDCIEHFDFVMYLILKKGTTTIYVQYFHEIESVLPCELRQDIKHAYSKYIEYELEQERKEKADKMLILVDYLRDKLVKDGIIENFSHPLFVEEEGELSEAEAVDMSLNVCANFLHNHHLLRNLSEADGDEQIKSTLSKIEIAIRGDYYPDRLLRKEIVQKVAREKKESLGAGGWSQEVAKAYQKVMIAFK